MRFKIWVYALLVRTCNVVIETAYPGSLVSKASK